jgi:hypothetical protein
MARAKNPKIKRDVKKIWLPRKHNISPMMRTKIQSFVSKYDLKMSIYKISREYLGTLYDYAKNKFRNPAVKSLSRIF